MPLFSRFKSRGAQPSSKSKALADLSNGKGGAAQKPRWESSWNSKVVALEEVEELVHICTAEMKSRAEALDAPFLLLPFRPDSDASSARTFIRNFYKSNAEGSSQYRGASLQQELRLTEPIVLCSIIKWCWSRMPSGVVTWAVYEGFQIGERESNMARNAFNTFIPISAESTARKNIIFDFFDLLAAVAAHGKMNGLGGRKLSRLAGWWAFEHSDDGKGFEGGYKSWEVAADAASHLFFAYLRSLSPEADPSMSVIERIPRSLQALLASTEYPPETPTLMQTSTPRVVMIVDSVSPTPFALLRRAKHFAYREHDKVLLEYQEFEDPLDALTEECKRVLYSISSINSKAAVSRHGNIAKPQESWSAFQNMGFSDMDENSLAQKSPNGMNGGVASGRQGLGSEPRSRNADFGRPTTPSWADFMSSGFHDDEVKTPTTLMIPPDQLLPPIDNRAQTPSHLMNMGDENLPPGELAAITTVELDDAFWWVWMMSLAGEEPAERKAVFGRCALVETSIMHGRWLIMEEQVKGASPDPAEGVFIAPRKSIFSFTKRGRMGTKRSANKKSTASLSDPLDRTTSATPSRSSLAPDQHSKIKAAAAALTQKHTNRDDMSAQRRGRGDEAAQTKTSSMLTMNMMSEATPAMKWASAYDKNAVRAQYLGDAFAGTGRSREDLVSKASSVNLQAERNSVLLSPPPALSPQNPPLPKKEEQLTALPIEEAPAGAGLPPLSVESRSVQDSRVPAAELTVVGADVRSVGESERSRDEAAAPVKAPSAFDKEVGVDMPSSPRTVGRKPVPQGDGAQEHPAFRQQSVEDVSAAPAPQIARSPYNSAAIAAQMAMASTTSAAPPSNNQTKSKKETTGGSGGLKKLFSRRKETTDRGSMDVQRPSSNGLSSPSESNLGRRLSMMRKKPAATVTPKSSQAIMTPASPVYDPATEPVMPDSHDQFNQPTTNLSRVDTNDETDHAEHAFSRFDQGQIEDVPTVLPQDSQDSQVHAPIPQRHFNTELASRIAPSGHETDGHDFASPIGNTHLNDDAQSEATMEEQPELQPVNDRWATIRENASKRAARASEEQSMQSRQSQSVKTDDGETSGEETIESRVARIKARVAELTGGMEGSGATRR